MEQVFNSALVEAAKNYEFVKCEKGANHQYYQCNQICLVDKCSYQLEALCSLDLQEKLFGHHQHQTRDLKSILIDVAQMCVRNQVKLGVEETMNPIETERLFLIAKDFRKIGESASNISDYLMEIINGTHGLKGLETLLWDIFLCKKEEELKQYLKKLRKHIREQRGEIVMREYKNPKNIVDKINAKKQQIEDEIINLTQSLKLEVQDLKAKAEIVRKPGVRNKNFYDTEEEFKLAFDRAQKKKAQDDPKKRLPRKAEFVKSIIYGQNVKDFGNKVYEGSGGKIDMMYSAKPFSKGVHEFGIKIEKFNKQKGHVYLILLKEDLKDKGGNFFSPFHCIWCQDGYDMVAFPQKTSCFGPNLNEGSVIVALADVEANTFEIKDQGTSIYYSSNTQLYGETWRFAIWWQNSNTRIRIF